MKYNIDVDLCGSFVFFFFKQKTAYEISACLVGSVIPVRNEVNAAESSSPATRFLFSGLAVWYIARQAPSRPNIMVIKRPDMKRDVPS